MLAQGVINRFNKDIAVFIDLFNSYFSASSRAHTFPVKKMEEVIKLLLNYGLNSDFAFTVAISGGSESFLRHLIKDRGLVFGQFKAKSFYIYNNDFFNVLLEYKLLIPQVLQFLINNNNFDVLQKLLLLDSDFIKSHSEINLFKLYKDYYTELRESRLLSEEQEVLYKIYHMQKVGSVYSFLSNKSFSRGKLKQYVSKFSMDIVEPNAINSVLDQQSQVNKIVNLIQRFALDVETILVPNPDGNWSPNVLRVVREQKAVVVIPMRNIIDFNMELLKVHGIILPGAVDSFSYLPKPFYLNDIDDARSTGVFIIDRRSKKMR